MMVKRLVLFGISVIFLSCFSGCEKPGGKGFGANELVKINNVSISFKEFRQMSEGQPLEGKMRLLDEKGLRDFLDNYVITREVLYQEAKQRGLDQNKGIMAKVEDFKRAMVIDALLEEVLKGKSEVSENEIQRYYKENENRFVEAQEIKIRHIVVNSEPALKEVLAKLAKGERFERLASIYNIDRTKEYGGDLGYIRRGQLVPSFSQFEEVAFSLVEKGQVSEVVRTPFGYHLIQLLEKRGATLKPFNQVKEKIRFFLQGKKRQDAYLEYVKEAKARANILINEKLWAEEEKKEPNPKEGKR